MCIITSSITIVVILRFGTPITGMIVTLKLLLIQICIQIVVIQFLYKVIEKSSDTIVLVGTYTVWYNCTRPSAEGTIVLIPGTRVPLYEHYRYCLMA